MDPLKMYFLLRIVIFHCYVSLPEGTQKNDGLEDFGRYISFQKIGVIFALYVTMLNFGFDTVSGKFSSQISAFPVLKSRWSPKGGGPWW